MNKFNWAMNDLKVDLAKKDLEFAQKINPAVVINEESIKAQYVKRGGLLVDEDSIFTVAEQTPETIIESRKVQGGGTAKRIIRRK